MSLTPTPSTKRRVVLVPTYNEAANIEKLCDSILTYEDIDIWILDDNSPDGTGQIADSLAANDARIRVQHRPNKEGLGKAYLQGYQLALDAGYDTIIQMDADFSHPPRFLPTFLVLIENHDVVLGSRWVKGGAIENWPPHRKLLSQGGSLYSRILLGLNIRDLTGGFKCFRREVLASIDLDAVRTTGYAFQIEITYRALCKGFSITETPICFEERAGGTSKMSLKIVLEAVLAVPQLRLKIR